MDEHATADRRADRIRCLTQASRALTYATTFDTVFHLAIGAARTLDASQAVVTFTESDGMLRIGAAHGIDDEEVARFRAPMDELVIERLHQLVGRSYPDPNFLGAPLIIRGEVVGFLAIWRNDSMPFDESEGWVLCALADHVSVAAENARLIQDHEREQQLLRAAENLRVAQERALRTLSHDLRDPLTAIISYSELIDMEGLGPVTQRQRDAIARIQASARHLVSVLDSVLEMARISAGALQIETQAVSVRDVIAESVQLMETVTLVREQTIHIDCDPALMVVAQPDRLRQVLINLLSNASKYAPERSAIDVTTEKRSSSGETHGVITVADEGPGIPEEQRELIFEPYYRLADASSKSGAGLGLAISRELVRRMGGDIEVESEPGCGSRFHVRLPAAR